MGIGVGLVLVAIGAILRFAVNVTTSGFNIHTIGVILMVIGAIGVVVGLVAWNSWAGPGRWTGSGGYRSRRVVTDAAGRQVVAEDRSQVL